MVACMMRNLPNMLFNSLSTICTHRERRYMCANPPPCCFLKAQEPVQAAESVAMRDSSLYSYICFIHWLSLPPSPSVQRMLQSQTSVQSVLTGHPCSLFIRTTHAPLNYSCHQCFFLFLCPHAAPSYLKETVGNLYSVVGHYYICS